MGGGKTDAPRRFRLRGWLVSTAAVALASACFISLQLTGALAHGEESSGGSAERVAVNASAFGRACASGAALPTSAFDLGSSFDGMPQTYRAETCNPAPEGPVASGPTIPVGDVTVSYGECKVTTEEGCSAPVTVESWPECARNPQSYRLSPRAKKHEEEATAQAAKEAEEEGTEGSDAKGDASEELNPSEPWTASANPNIPGASFEEGRRVELYAGDTTIVIFASEPGIAKAAADALARIAAPSPTGSSLQAEAERPGDGSTCPKT
jgi:hypothetical protein